MPGQHPLGRRDFLKTTPLVIGGLAALAQRGFADEPQKPAGVTVGDIIGRVLAEHAGVERIPDTIDTIKTGDAARPVRGIVTTFMATADVIRRAIERDADFLITHEPTFYSHRDETDWLEHDPVYAMKRRLLDDHGVTVWRYHDHIHEIRPDPIFTGLIERLGWSAYVDPDDGRICHIPQTTLAELVAHCKRRLGAEAIRYVGAPQMTCTNVGLSPGAAGGRSQIGFLTGGAIDVLICGEVAEWETTEYARDSQDTSKPVGLIVTGHRCSEEDGMRLLADWLKTRYPGIPVTHVPASDPYRFA